MAILRWFRARLRDLLTGYGRRHEKSLEAVLGLSGRLVAHKPPRHSAPPQVIGISAIDEIGRPILEKAIVAGSGEAGLEAIRVADSQAPAQSCAADLHQDGSITFSIRGRSRQGEEGNLAVCSILLERLNQGVERWTGCRDVSKRPNTQEGDIDCEAYNGDQMLKVQLTRAEPDTRTWKALGSGETSRRYENASEVADGLRQVIQVKARKIPQGDHRKEILLALDATETGAQVLTRVITSFRERHTAWAVQLGFREIWVIGPTHDLTFRLDAD